MLTISLPTFTKNGANLSFNASNIEEEITKYATRAAPFILFCSTLSGSLRRISCAVELDQNVM